MKNTYKCSAKLWWRLSDKAKQIFNSVMDQSLKNQKITSHPNMERMSTRQWETLCHNFSLYAAWAHDLTPLKKGDPVVDVD